MTPRAQVSLGDYTTMGVGGAARFFFEARTSHAIVEALGWAHHRALPVEVLGGGSNVVIADRGLDALVLRVRDTRLRVDGEDIEVGAGMAWDELVAWSVTEGRAGLECLSGIPGDVGAAPMQNVGAYGQEVSETITRVEVIERASGRRASFDRAACAFGYRDSVFKRAADGRYVVASVAFRLRAGGAASVRYPELQRAVAHEQPTLAEVRAAVLALRRSKSMVIDAADDNRRSCGSFFLNPVVSADEADHVATRAADDTMPRYPAAGGVKLSAAWLIERAGLVRGTARGPVGLSSRHALAIVNRGGASAADVVAFASEVRARVRERFGVSLCPEPRFLGFGEGELRGLFD